jgi:Zn-dependent peptidase ImmA (M78 family)
MTPYLPASIRLPGNYVIRVKMRAPSTLRREAKGECYGYWDGKTRTICIDKTASPRKQRYTLTHEMVHALADWQHVYLEEDT